MIEIANIRVKGMDARSSNIKKIPKGLIGGYITVEYSDPIWNELRKTVVFQGSKTVDVITESSRVLIPTEVLQDVGKRVYVGFYGASEASKTIIPTFWVEIGMIVEATYPFGDESSDPTLPIWAQLASEWEDLKKSGFVGPTPELSVGEVETLPPEAQATVEISGTKEKPILNFGIPQGKPGEGSKEPTDLKGYATEEWVKEGYQPKGNYLTKVPDGYAKTEDIPTKPQDIGAQPAGNYALRSEIPSVPVQSVNGKTGAVQLGAADVGARPSTWMPTAADVGALPSTYTPPNQTAEQVGADPKGTAAGAVSQHNTDETAHNDIRLLIEALSKSKLDASALAAAINAALAQAKQSGEFDGKTPVKFVDYWTPADQEEIVQQVITALGTPVFGRVDADKNIILTGALADGIYKLWYEDENGKMTELCTYDTGPGYINWIKQSTEADGTPYNGGQGYKTNTRLSSSGAESTSDAEGMECTGFIPFKRGDVIRFSGITMNGSSSNAGRCYFIQYKDNDSGEKEMLKQWNVSAFRYAITQGHVLTDVDGNITQINTAEFADESNTSAISPIYTNAAYFRISADEINDDSIITINQEIPEEEPPYINKIPRATDSSESIYGEDYNGDGVKDGYKIGVRVSNGVEQPEDGIYTTGFIPVAEGDVVYLKNVTMPQNGTTYNCRVSLFSSLTSTDQKNIQASNAAEWVWDENGNAVQFTVPAGWFTASGVKAKFMRIGASYIGVDSIITINEPIE